MRYQLATLSQNLGDSASFEYLEGTRPWKEDAVEPALRARFGEGPYFGWYGVTNDGDPSRKFLDLLTDKNVVFTYTEIERAIERLEEAIETRGPFDVLLGFSQGAIPVTCLTAKRLERQRNGGEGPEWKMNLIVCGIPPRDNRYIELTRELAFPCCLVPTLSRRHFISLCLHLDLL